MDYVYTGGSKTFNHPFEFDSDEKILSVIQTGVNLYTFTIEGNFSGMSFLIGNSYSGKTSYNSSTGSGYGVNFIVTENSSVDRIANSRGTIENYGRIETSVSGKSLVNYGYIDTVGTITDAYQYGAGNNRNYGTVKLWCADAGENESDGVILEVGDGSLNKVNSNFGFIDVNNGTVDNNDSGVIGYNNGNVNTNKADGRILNNTSSGTVQDNKGTISKNSGDISHLNTGVVYENTNESLSLNPANNTGTITSDSDPELPGLLALYYPAPVSEEPSDENSSEAIYNASLRKLSSDIAEMAKMLTENTDGKKEQTIYYEGGHSLPVDVLKTLKSYEGVILDFRCTYEGKDYHFVIKGGKNMVLDESVKWYGPLCLAQFYGVVED